MNEIWLKRTFQDSSWLHICMTNKKKVLALCFHVVDIYPQLSAVPTVQQLTKNTYADSILFKSY